jgi:hypothetical protein
VQSPSRLSAPGPELSQLFRPLQDGLAQQLLGVVVAHERPDLENSRQELICEMSGNKTLLSKLEDTLLRELSNATGAAR